MEDKRGVPEGHHTVTPYLVVSDASALASFLRDAFDGELLLAHERADGNVAHVEVRLGDARVMIGRASDGWQAMPAMVHLYLPDCDAAYRQAIAAGATSVQEPALQLYGDRSGGVRDAWGNIWWLATRV